ncbi:Ig-like domain-containing protein [Paenibacillus yanchengensis]|uniref:Ig-like domain-containing protein n=1 Tax=Paenibacillus yanchengensis TaxID=2035833 RepID=A0ABW4YPE2_9BACL
MITNIDGERMHDMGKYIRYSMMFVVIISLLGVTSYSNGSVMEEVYAESSSPVVNLVKNGGFEARSGMNGCPLDWRCTPKSGSFVYEYDTTDKQEGTNSFKIASIEEKSRLIFDTRVDINEAIRGKKLQFTAKLKTEAITNRVFARIQYYDFASKAISSIPMIELFSLKQDNDWTQVEQEFEVPTVPEAVFLRIEFLFETGTGTVWLDDFTMQPLVSIDSMDFIEANPIVLDVGAKRSLVDEIIFQPALTAGTSLPRLQWQSSHADVATLDEAGEVTAQQAGLTIATVEVANGSSLRASIPIFVGDSSEMIAVTEDNTPYDVVQSATVQGQLPVAESDPAKNLTGVLAKQPYYGQVQIDNTTKEWSYTANDDFVGSDYFYIFVTDDEDGMGVSRINMNVMKANSAPIVTEKLYMMDKPAPGDAATITGTIIVSDPDGDSLQYTVVEQPQEGQLSLTANGKWSYELQNRAFTGVDPFVVKVSDGIHQVNTTVNLYIAPTATEIIAELKVKNPQQQHPRLLATAADFDRMKGLLQTDPLFQSWFEQVKKATDQLLTQPIVPYKKPDGLRLDTTASNYLVQLAFMYQITGEEKYAARAWDELENVSSTNYPDWSHQHFLDTAMTSFGVSIAYDWLYDYLDDDQKSTVRTAIVTKALKEAEKVYKAGNGWAIDVYNWNFVSNAGMIAGALAVADDGGAATEALAGSILNYSFKSLQYGLRQYAPDGSAIEGPAYWEYGTRYLVYLLHSLETTFGHDFGFSTYEGLFETPNYPIYIAGNTGTFNYSDNEDSFISGQLLLWFAKQQQQPGFAWYHQYSNKKMNKIGVYDLLWYDPELYEGGQPEQKDYEFTRQPLVTMRSNWEDPYGTFVGFKGGVNGAPHGDLDIGTFVLDALGVRWAVDLGKEDYNLPGFWDRNEASARWTYYRKRPDGHNTLVINPTENPKKTQQIWNAYAPIVARQLNKTSDNNAFAITDMSAAYAPHGVHATRGVALINERREFVVRDEVKLKKASELYWFMHTAAEIDIVNNGQTAILTDGDKRLVAKLVNSSAAQFTVMDAAPMTGTLNPNGQTANHLVKKLAVVLQADVNVTDVSIAVQMTPLLPGEALPANNSYTLASTPLAEWGEVEGTTSAKLSDIKMNGQSIADFSPEQYTYVQSVAYGDALPVISADTLHPEHTVTVTNISSNVVQIDVVDEQQQVADNRYFVQFVIEEEISGTPNTTAPTLGLPTDATKIPVTYVTASGHDGNVPENTIDNKLETRWSDEGNSWIMFELDKPYVIQQLSAIWFKGLERISEIKIEVSANGYIWDRVYEGKTSGQTADYKTYPLRAVEGKFVRIKLSGNTINAWNSLIEAAIFGEEPAPVTPTTPPTYIPPVVSGENTITSVTLRDEQTLLALDPVFASDVTVYSATTQAEQVELNARTAADDATVQIAVTAISRLLEQ